MATQGAAESVVLITIDRETVSASLTFADGGGVTAPLATSPFANSSSLTRIHFSPPLQIVYLVTQSGDEVALEFPARDAAGQLDGRPVVYLDQNQWSVLNNAHREPSRVTAGDLAAAQQIAEWARERRIILPMSAGHYHETTKRFDAGKRYGLGLTMLQLSRGWQMRDPLDVRRSEMADGYRRRRLGNLAAAARTLDVFTLLPNVLFGPTRPQRPATKADWTALVDMTFYHQALTSITAMADTLLDANRIEPGVGEGWSAHNQAFSEWIDKETREVEQKKKSIDALLLVDLQQELAEEAAKACVSLDDFRGWFLQDAVADMQEMPSIGVYREVLHERHLNKGTRWRSNDLTDMIYLSCAAGYADFVICERHMCAMLRQGARRTKASARTFRRLRDAAPEIEDALAAVPASR